MWHFDSSKWLIVNLTTSQLNHHYLWFDLCHVSSLRRDVISWVGECEQWKWTTNMTLWTRGNILNKFCPCQRVYFLTYFCDMEKYSLTQLNIFPYHQCVHVAFNGFKLFKLKGLRCLWTSISYNRLGTRQPREGVHAWFLMGIYDKICKSFVIVEINLAIVICRIVLPFVNVWRSLVPYKQSNAHQTCFMITINTQIDYTLTNMSLSTYMFTIVDYFGQAV
jgi:hypothetical protein